jgi:hypothetical protein
MKASYLESVKKQFAYYKLLGEKTIEQMTDAELNWQYNEDSNSIATIIKHLTGNMLSRWTDFLQSDGEKEWRDRDREFVIESTSGKELKDLWDKGWNCLFDTLNDLTIHDLNTVIYIRNMGHTVSEAINRQLAHYPYHIGQMVYIGKMIKGIKWVSLSIPKGDSVPYNKDRFSEKREVKHFVDEYMSENDKNIILPL